MLYIIRYVYVHKIDRGIGIIFALQSLNYEAKLRGDGPMGRWQVVSDSGSTQRALLPNGEIKAGRRPNPETQRLSLVYGINAYKILKDGAYSFWWFRQICVLVPEIGQFWDLPVDLTLRSSRRLIMSICCHSFLS